MQLSLPNRASPFSRDMSASFALRATEISPGAGLCGFCTRPRNISPTHLSGVIDVIDISISSLRVVHVPYGPMWIATEDT